MQGACLKTPLSCDLRAFASAGHPKIRGGCLSVLHFELFFCRQLERLIKAAVHLMLTLVHLSCPSIAGLDPHLPGFGLPGLHRLPGGI